MEIATRDEFEDASQTIYVRSWYFQFRTRRVLLQLPALPSLDFAGLTLLTAVP
jgi:hypothetical protein